MYTAVMSFGHLNITLLHVYVFLLEFSFYQYTGAKPVAFGHEGVNVLSGRPQDRWEPFSACPVPAEAHWVAQHGLACFTHTLPVWGMYTLSFQNQTY